MIDVSQSQNTIKTHQAHDDFILETSSTMVIQFLVI